ncbi:hypothetical protein J4727_14560 [Providencia rettgeri]|uniref:Uncharacterized protein n=1 Tax=Providencia rettgeri TaxID=587 RepID=A0A939NHM0_PRORE|nr:hypothetical protein [Providencia rettgeri]
MANGKFQGQIAIIWRKDRAWWLPDIGEGDIKPLSTDSKVNLIEHYPANWLLNR